LEDFSKAKKALALKNARANNRGTTLILPDVTEGDLSAEFSAYSVTGAPVIAYLPQC